VKSAKSLSINSKVEFSVGYFKPKLFLAYSMLEFLVEPKILIASSERCHSMEFQLFSLTTPFDF
jgi:hypothetical protein